MILWALGERTPITVRTPVVLRTEYTTNEERGEKREKEGLTRRQGPHSTTPPFVLKTLPPSSTSAFNILTFITFIEGRSFHASCKLDHCARPLANQFRLSRFSQSRLGGA